MYYVLLVNTSVCISTLLVNTCIFIHTYTAEIIHLLILCTTELVYNCDTMITRAAIGSLAAILSALGSNKESRSPENALKPILTSQCPSILTT
jgi:hypothetical protein